MNSTHDHLKAAIDPDAIFVQDGNSYTSAGVTAGSDLAVALVESDLAGPLVLSVAREMVVCIKRCGALASRRVFTSSGIANRVACSIA